MKTTEISMARKLNNTKEDEKMRKQLKCIPVTAFLVVVLLISIAQPSRAFEVTMADPLKVDLYGYFATRYEKVWDEPALEGSKTVKEDSPGEWDNPYVNLMGQSQIWDKYKVYFNLNGESAGNVDVRNIWGEYSPSERFNVRIGKIYRKFGLYNEILDAVPTYIGIEPPELFDGDHLILSRTTTLMVHGKLPLGDGTLNYGLYTDNGEGGKDDDTFPLGLDLNYRFGDDNQVVGLSAYHSFGETGSDVDVGDGSPDGGVLPWMAEDEFWVLGGYVETNIGNLLLQAAYWHASHDAERDVDSVITVVNDAGINATQLDRFLIDPTAPAAPGNVDTDGDYDVDTWYIRAGYSMETGVGEIVPYVQWDWYENEETIKSKTYGGDNEAGAADDGEFNKATIGVVYRPIPKLAIKLDGSGHFYEFNGEDEWYPEVRLDVSWIFGL